MLSFSDCRMTKKKKTTRTKKDKGRASQVVEESSEDTQELEMNQ